MECVEARAATWLWLLLPDPPGADTCRERSRGDVPALVSAGGVRCCRANEGKDEGMLAKDDGISCE